MVVLIWEVAISTFFYKNFRNNDGIEDLVKQSVDFYIKELGLNSESLNISLKVGFPERMTTIHGYVEKYRYKCMPGTYDITIYSNHSIFSILCTVAHEMIHVQQWESGDLNDDGFRRIWKGEDHTHTDYADTPWEKEAFRKEKALAEKFYKHMKMKRSIIAVFFEAFLPI